MARVEAVTRNALTERIRYLVALFEWRAWGGPPSVVRSRKASHPHVGLALAALPSFQRLPQFGSIQRGHWLPPIRLLLQDRID